jgi:hypothetical protein
LLRIEAEKEMKNRGLWGEAEENEMKELRKKLLVGSRKLPKGGIKLSEGKKLALQMIKDRRRLLELSLMRSALDGLTAEAQAEQHRFNYLVSVCSVYNDNDQRVFESLEDYLEKSDTEWGTTIANKFSSLMTDIEDYKANLPEHKFLVKYKFMNDKYQLVDEKGRAVNEDGRHVDEDGRYIKWLDNEKFVFVDIEGNEVDKDGEYVIEHMPFLDENGEPVLV